MGENSAKSKFSWSTHPQEVEKKGTKIGFAVVYESQGGRFYHPAPTSSHLVKKGTSTSFHNWSQCDEMWTYKQPLYTIIQIDRYFWRIWLYLITATDTPRKRNQPPQCVCLPIYWYLLYVFRFINQNLCSLRNGVVDLSSRSRDSLRSEVAAEVAIVWSRILKGERLGRAGTLSMSKTTHIQIWFPPRSFCRLYWYL